MDEVISLEELQVDALREVANIGAGHAATALSQMTNHRIMISVPEINIARLDEVPELLGVNGQNLAVVYMLMLGDLTGRTLLVLERTKAFLLCDMLMHRPFGTTQAVDPLVESGLKEAANIVGSAYLNALAEFMGMMLLPSVPTLIMGDAPDVLSPDTLKFGRSKDVVFSVQTAFEFQGFEEEMEGYYLVFPDVASLKRILDAIRLG